MRATSSVAPDEPGPGLVRDRRRPASATGRGRRRSCRSSAAGRSDSTAPAVPARASRASAITTRGQHGAHEEPAPEHHGGGQAGWPSRPYTQNTREARRPPTGAATCRTARGPRARAGPAGGQHGHRRPGQEVEGPGVGAVVDPGRVPAGVVQHAPWRRPTPSAADDAQADARRAASAAGPTGAGAPRARAATPGRTAPRWPATRCAAGATGVENWAKYDWCDEDGVPVGDVEERRQRVATQTAQVDGGAADPGEPNRPLTTA